MYFSDTSPRGVRIAGDDAMWDFGLGEDGMGLWMLAFSLCFLNVVCFTSLSLFIFQRCWILR